ncbi:Hypothetical_protein [Hexamita inflata]|uniref:Hypothetical_protein n=1 Tax=Hexamita inflata TaxID=28002 RepID=A0AA86UFE4_9EUKA|nr:Hypothetical protein HINF_LOCUS41384 [Hexamita inflata]
MVRRRWIPVKIGLHEAAAQRPWMLVPESLVALAAEVRLTYIGVSKTNDHSCELTVPVQQTELVQTKVKVDIYINEWSYYNQRNILKSHIKTLMKEETRVKTIVHTIIHTFCQLRIYAISNTK